MYFDLETTSLNTDCDITQIAAVSGSSQFNTYVSPEQKISPKAAAVTGLTTQGGILFLHGNPVSAIPLCEALREFFSYLQSRAPVLLVAHNSTFDSTRLL